MSDEINLTTYGGKPTPMNFILHLRTYGLKIRYHTPESGIIPRNPVSYPGIRYHTPESGLIQWNRDEISLRRIHFQMAHLRAMIHGLVASTQRQLFHELLLIPPDEDGRPDLKIMRDI